MMNMLYEMSEHAPKAPAARCCHSQLIPRALSGVIHPQQHQQKRLCCGFPTLQWLSSHPNIFKPQNKICTLQQRHRLSVPLCHTGPALPRGNAYSRTALPNTSSCLRQQLSKASQGKIHLGVADPILPQAMCALRLCAFMPVSYGM